MRLEAEINKKLAEMRLAGTLQKPKEKGARGEEAVLLVALEQMSKNGGIVYHSLKYPYQKYSDGTSVTGNIVYKDGQWLEYSSGGDRYPEEIDIVYISPYRIFLIEAKAYHIRKVGYVDQYWMKRDGDLIEKSPIAQTEKHARHFYHAMYKVIPNGDPHYIIPLVCFVDRCKIEDDRDQENQHYIPITIINGLRAMIRNRNTPLEYNLDLKAIRKKIDEIKISTEKEFV